MTHSVYIKQQWRPWAALSNSSAQPTCIRMEAVYSYDNRLIHAQLVYPLSIPNLITVTLSITTFQTINLTGSNRFKIKNILLVSKSTGMILRLVGPGHVAKQLLARAVVKLNSFELLWSFMLESPVRAPRNSFFCGNLDP